ncbi:unnamed protein product [Prorocentrum cordatum]|uniref:Protein xylosyltransferase n=1 Tax=Prorocentrum cordatum TaxID=2364126 RepID=A0ABN9T865_9DINO|nr:unnamed protein product [Polarella glacialis]
MVEVQHPEQPWNAREISLHLRWRINSSADVSKENGWRFGMFLRDPAERFLSSWLSKCVLWEDDGRMCLGRRVPSSNRSSWVPAFEEVVDWMLPEYMMATGHLGVFNAHYDPQHVFCGGKPLDEYDFVGVCCRGMASQVRSMLEGAASLPKDHPIWSMLPQLFPAPGPGSGIRGPIPGPASESAMGPDHLRHHTGAEGLMGEFYRDPATFDKVVTAYAEDYRRFLSRAPHLAIHSS